MSTRRHSFFSEPLVLAQPAYRWYSAILYTRAFIIYNNDLFWTTPRRSDFPSILLSNSFY